MPVSSQALTGDLSQVLRSASDALSSSLRVAVPGIIQSFDPNTVTCVVLPAITGAVPDANGMFTTTTQPLLLDLPVVFPRGGGITLTFPIKAGDECLVIFSDRCIDFWYQSGNTADRVDFRQHDTSDAFVIVGPQSQTHKISGISTSSAQLRTDDGAAFVELDPASHAINIKTSGNLIAQASGSTTISSPTITFNGAVTINGTAKVSGDVTAGGKSLINHVHGGVQIGGGNTGKPQ